jgi:hypothetical protein
MAKKSKGASRATPSTVYQLKITLSDVETTGALAAKGAAVDLSPTTKQGS